MQWIISKQIAVEAETAEEAITEFEKTGKTMVVNVNPRPQPQPPVTQASPVPKPRAITP